MIAFIDQDDLWVPEKLNMQMAAFEADPALDVCVGYIQRFRDTAHGRVKRGKPVPGYLSVTLLAKRALFDLHLFDAARKYSNSADWSLHVQAAGCNIRLLPDLLTLHRDHADNLSLMHGDESRQEFLHTAQGQDRSRTRSIVIRGQQHETRERTSMTRLAIGPALPSASWQWVGAGSAAELAEILT